MIITIEGKKITGTLTLNPKSHEDKYLIEGRVQVDDDSFVEDVDLYEYDNGVLSLSVGWEDIKATRDAEELADRTVHMTDVMRTERNRLLAETDWTASTDVTMSAEMTTYRQALRDLPTTTEDVFNPTYPEL